MFLLSEILKQRFLEYTGTEFPNSPFGEFSTEHPYNNREWPYDPWWVMYVYDASNGCLSILLYHRMTNPRYHAFDHKGNELDPEIAEDYICQFENHTTYTLDLNFVPSYKGELKPYPENCRHAEKIMAQEITKELDKQIIQQIKQIDK